MLKRPSFIITIIIVLVVFGLGFLSAALPRGRQIAVIPQAANPTIEEDLSSVNLGDLDREFEAIDKDINQL